MRTTDNNLGCKVHDALAEDLAIIGNATLKQLSLDQPGLLIFPGNLGDHDDDLGSNCIYNIWGDTLTTQNIMGFIGVNNSQLIIASRFQESNSDHDYFLHYMLQEVYALNLLDLKTGTKEEDIWEIILVYMFSYYLNQALNQGIYKEYQDHNYNDANVKGRIDINRHIKLNKPFMGNVAYKTRNHTSDNRLNQLVRHTIDHALSNDHQGVLSNTATWQSFNQIMQVTPTYNALDRSEIIKLNRKRITHPYYSLYEPLRRICLRLLSRKGLSFGNEKDKAYGLLFDGAWLWEEYLNKVLSRIGYKHPKNKLRRAGDPVYLFQDNRGDRYPDFYHVEKKIVIDAKYKALQNGLSRDDLNQLITYVHILRNDRGCFLYPSLDAKLAELGVLNGYGGLLSAYGIQVPVGCKSYADFVQGMKNSEQKLTAYFGK